MKYNDTQFPMSDKLIKVIGGDILTEILQIYNSGKQSIKEILKDDDYNFPSKELKKIMAILDKLKGKGWLTEIGLRDAESTIKNCILRTEKGHRYLRKKMLKNILKTGGREKQNPSLHLLIVLLVKLLIEKTGKKHYAWVGQFLQQNDIAVKGDNEINKLYKEGIKDVERLKEIRFFSTLINSFEKEITEEEVLEKLTEEIKNIVNTFQMSPEDVLNFYERYVDAVELYQ
jgi:hypothetical protein